MLNMTKDNDTTVGSVQESVDSGVRHYGKWKSDGGRDDPKQIGRLNAEALLSWFDLTEVSGQNSIYCLGSINNASPGEGGWGGL